jgi:amino acid adenylation domain-containing protein
MTDETDAIAQAMRAELEAELMALAERQPENVPPKVPVQPDLPRDQEATDRALTAFRDQIANLAAAVLKIPLDRLDPRENMSRYGVDSIIVTEIMKRISDVLGLPIAPTVFFEARHLEDLADILYRRYEGKLAPGPAGDPAAGDRASSSEMLRPAAKSTGPFAEGEVKFGADVTAWIDRFKSIARQPRANPAETPSASLMAVKSSKPVYEPVAIIAMDGMFAESADLSALERHLRAGDDCIREVPAERWDWRQVFGDPKQGPFTDVKYGGFAPDIDKFDPTFFGLSPREAELMDPQHRRFIQCVWSLIESAGYAPQSLAGRKIGMFIGINLLDYAQLIDRAGSLDAAQMTSLGHMFCPNRLSFYLDIHGPSQVIDTACSSSLVALHRAVLSIQHEGCEMAIAGGANLLISPDLHVMYSKVGMICADGRCKTFSKDANGYVRGDGIGAVLLKPLSAAERDGDIILAVIRGSAENHGGMSTSLTAPNARAQADLIVEAHRRAGIDPRSVGYIECHGTGTALGDPIEIDGLKAAFAELHRASDLPMPDRPYCGLGSVKSNIGHAETAAGIAGVIKSVLSLRHRYLYPTLHCSDLNPLIDLGHSPFYILQEGAPWQRLRIDGVEQPRRAGISSFGAGGSNAHVVIEEYLGPQAEPAPDAMAPVLILLSAKTRSRLADVVVDLKSHFDALPAADLPHIADIAYTLQLGRDAMPERLALSVDSLAELRTMLARLVAGEEAPSGCHRGSVKRGRNAAVVSAGAVSAAMATGDRRELAQLWVNGATIDWAALQAKSGRICRRVPLPSYPFARQRHWLPAIGGARQDWRSTAQAEVPHPLIQEDRTVGAARRFTTRLTGAEFFLSDHVVMGEQVLPGVAYLEMARAALARMAPAPEHQMPRLALKNVVWVRPFVMSAASRALHIELLAQGDQTGYRIYSQAGADNSETILHAQGTAVPFAGDGDAADVLDIAALRDAITHGRPDHHCLDAAACYAAFAAMGLAYGPGHRGLDQVYYSPPGGAQVTPQVLARLHLPAASAAQASAYVLHPGLIDSALQACIGFLAAAGQPLPGDIRADGTGPTAALPFALDRFELIAAPEASAWVWIRPAAGTAPDDRLQKFDLDLCNADGRIALRMRGFSTGTAEEAPATLICEPVWLTQPVAANPSVGAWAQRHLLLCDLAAFFPESVERDLALRLPGITCSRLALTGEVADWYRAATAGVFDKIKALFADTAGGQTLLQVLVPNQGVGALLGGLSGLTQTANRESTRVFCQLIALDDASGVAQKMAGEDGATRAEWIRFIGSRREIRHWREQERLPASGTLPWKHNGIYLVAGGGGGLGRLFAQRIAAEAHHATIILCGRSKCESVLQQWIAETSGAGLTVEYRTLDVGRLADVEALIADTLRRHGRIDGIIHAAGLLQDNFIVRKDSGDFAAVLAPKVAGSLNLDLATRALDLDFFALFASGAGAWGSAGQADYAAANAFMDAFAHHRATLVAAGQRQGLTVAIDWPYWADGGMRMEPAALSAMRRAVGAVPLPNAAGMLAFDAALSRGSAQALVLHGIPSRLRRLLDPPATRTATPDPVLPGDTALPPALADLRRPIEQMLLTAVAQIMKFDPADLDADAEWSDCGFDSITLTDFSNRLNQQYQLDLTPTIFFEYPSIADLGVWLADAHGATLATILGIELRPAAPLPQPAPASVSAAPSLPATVATEPRTGNQAIAVIGMSGRFPMAPDLDAFWENLLAGRDCITSFPADRWDWGATPDRDGAAETDINWGGFIDGIADFDARFFGISPREAELMDPQQRLLMHYVWKAIEDAGYAAGSLSGSRTGLFIATASSGYGEMMARKGAAIESYSSTGTVGSVGPNRMSYFLNLHGPSEPIETACSSALVAVHRALTAIANGDCDQAIVGGINLIISPETHESFAKAGMLCPDGRCKTFSKQANGYVRGEGVGMLFLKKLDDAERAGDQIHGVIRGSAENHGGRATSLTAPNPKAQAELIKTAVTRAGIDPRSIGYIEAHGTGTELGDPVEINGLKSAFRDLYDASGGDDAPVPHCGLGSVKTNIGHLELAAGIAGLIKVLLQLKHRRLVRSLHCDEINPYIQLAGSPFYLVQENRDWLPPTDAAGHPLPRRAGVSSFGFGGVNAHVVLEEYAQKSPALASREAATPGLIVLSAKSEDRLKASAEALLAFISRERTTAAAPVETAFQDRLCVLLAEILQTEPSHIDPTRSLEEYGVDLMHRSACHIRMQEELGIALRAEPFLRNPTIAEIAAELLAQHPELKSQVGFAGAAPESTESALDLNDLAYTLQIGRDPMAERLAMAVHSLADLAEKLRSYLAGGTEAAPGIHLGSVKQNKNVAAMFGDDEELQEALAKWLRRGKFAKLLDLWVKGVDIAFEKLYGKDGLYRIRPRRISVPGYPFAAQRYWIQPQPMAALAATALPAQLHPLLHENISVLGQIRFGALLQGTEFFLADHRLQGRAILPGVAYLEMARAAFARVAAPKQGAVCRLRNVVWIAPATVDRPLPLQIDLSPGIDGEVRYDIRSDTPDGAKVLHGQGVASQENLAPLPDLDLSALSATLDPQVIGRDEVYALFAAAGFGYGPAHQAINQLRLGTDQVLAQLVLPPSVASTLDRYMLHPSLLDGALQAAIGLGMGQQAAPGATQPRPALPFAIERVDVFAACQGNMWAWVRRRPGNERLQKLDIDLCDEAGHIAVAIRGFAARLLEAEKPHPAVAPLVATAPVSVSAEVTDIKSRAIAYFKALLAATLKADIAEIDADEALETYGIDSMMVMELTAVLEKPFGALPKTLFFDYRTLADLADHLIEKYRAPLLQVLGETKPALPPAADIPASFAPVSAAPASIAAPRPQLAPPRHGTGALDIAIIGMSGRYPKARDLAAYWQNLRTGQDCITEVPPDRWDWRSYYREQPDQPGHACKWGGFIEDVDKFDPLFFNISPGAAEYMDPQERLFLEHAWMAMEDAGYRRDTLRQPPLGAQPDEDLPGQIGVYVGVMYGEYQFLGVESGLAQTGVTMANFYASIANRVSYALDLHGPSLAVDTMCSSSLTAIHLACQDLVLGRTEMAFAGGVNLNLHPNKYSLLSAGKFISNNGRCESFGAGGDGYVPSEGVGVVLLKRLADAERDGDQIHGVIKSSALNHGGRTNGYSVPNPKAQQMVIARALREAGIDPRSVGYIEAHGTGTRLGDPIEIAGLSRAFERHFAGDQFCWIGSSKSNIGHSEGAAGIAGLSKVLLQMRAGEIAPSLHAETLNPGIDFATTPFRVNRELRDWPQPVLDGDRHPRAAGVSSFGAGGANAHLIVAEYIAGPSAPRAAEVDLPSAIILSAKTEEQLAQSARNLLAFAQRCLGLQQACPALADIAYTLQVGREAMPCRLAFVAGSLTGMIDRLADYDAGRHGSLHLGRAKPGNASLAAEAQTALQDRRLDDALALWVRGADIDWQKPHEAAASRPARISLPTYPFARDRCWVTLPQVSRPLATLPPVQDPAPDTHDEADVLMLSPQWHDRTVPAAAEPIDLERRLICVGIGTAIPGAVMLPGVSRDVAAAARDFTDLAVRLFEEIKGVFRQGQNRPLLLQIVTVAEPLAAALVAMLRTARMENPQLLAQLVELDRQPEPGALAEMLRENSRARTDIHIRYRNGRRQVRAWTELPPPPPAPCVWQEGGVYLITGGAGGLGLIFAREIVNKVQDVTLFLTGRSSLNDTRAAALERLRTNGARIAYRQVDVADPVAVNDLLASIAEDCRTRGRRLNGILHSAGILGDGLIARKSTQELCAVLAPKVAGVVNLDLASRACDLDFFILFSSLAGATGNVGQADYATGNAFLDSYAAYRQALVSGEITIPGLPRPSGQTLSVNWPLWQQGGMTVSDPVKEMMWRSTGLRPLQSDAGIECLYRSLASSAAQVLVLQGDGTRLRQLFLDAEPPRPVASTRSDAAAGGEQLLGKVEAMLAQMVSDLLKIPLHRIERDMPLEQYGIDSVTMMKLTDDLEKIIGSVPRTLFFEYPSVAAASAYLLDSCRDALTALLDAEARPAVPPQTRAQIPHPQPVSPRAEMPAPAVPAANTAGLYDVAVIGAAGRFPQAPDLTQFWQNLVAGRDCIGEIPPERWDHQAYFDPDRSKLGKTSCKWGGFLSDVDQFDAAFFKVAPHEAALLDPQERLFMETVWNLLETSGYLGETMQDTHAAQAGVFVGSMSQQYHAFDSDAVREAIVALSSASSIANRISYFFNLRGPSIAIDTMCSSSLVAIHMACESLLKGECRIAIAGGVNLSIHPKKYIALSAGEMIGSSAASRAFAQGDGYLPAEGVGAILLKPLAAAIADQDDILAVIKSTAVNHNGQSNGYRVPSASAQAELIAANFTRAGIDPRTVSYVEAAANGSPLGDAIEVRALTSAFQKFTADRQFCAIGAVKSNIGHAEAASGISQFLKVILQLRHRQLVPTVMLAPLNPNIDFAATPFRLQGAAGPWERPVLALPGETAREHPRIATISAFGAGGTNAHLIVEEYRGASLAALHDQAAPQVIPLSARNRAGIAAVAAQLLAHVEQMAEFSLADLAYTLQTGREAMAFRLALVVSDRAGLCRSLRTYLSEGRGPDIFTGDPTRENDDARMLLSSRAGGAMIEALLADRNWQGLARAWAAGAKVPWHGAWQRDPMRRRVALPTYPFERKRHWLTDPVPITQAASAQATSTKAPTAAASDSAAAPFDGLPPSRAAILTYLTENLAEGLGLAAGDIDPQANLADYGVESISLTRWRRDLERAFGVALATRDMFANPTLAQLADHIAAQISSSGDDALRQPLSEGQQGLWLLQQMNPTMAAYNLPIVLRFESGLDAAAVHRAYAHVLEIFPLLRMAFVESAGAVWQEMATNVAPAFSHEVVADVTEAEIVDRLRARSKLPFDLARGPLIRAHLLSQEAGPDYLLLTAHHLILDGRSTILLTEALMAAYGDVVAGRGLAPSREQAPYAAFVQWQQAFMASKEAARQLTYWRSQLAGPLPVLSLRGDHPRPARPSYAGASLGADLPADFAQRIVAFSRAQHLTLSVPFLGAFNLLLHRLSGDDDLLVGMPTLGRPEARFDRSLGYFVNMIVIRSRFSGRATTQHFLQDLQRTVADGLDHGDYPFPALLRDLGLAQGGAQPSLFQTMFAYQNFGLPDIAGAGGNFIPAVSQEGTHDLALEVYQAADGFRLKLDYSTDLFAAPTIARILEQYLQLLGSLVEQPSSPLGTHRLLSDAQRAQILGPWSRGPETAATGDTTVIDLFRQQAARQPQLPALLSGSDVLTYAALEQQSDALAHDLLADGIFTGGDRVAVCLGRGTTAIIAMLAVWKAGGVFVPLATDQPIPRLARMLADSGATLLITDAETRDRVMSHAGDKSLRCRVPEEPMPSSHAPDLVSRCQPDQPAYVVYTSGSTGAPKGVIISHRSLSRHVDIMRTHYAITPADRMLQFASLSVDAALEQVLPALIAGASVLIRPEALWSAQQCRQAASAFGLTMIDVPPGYLHELLLDTARHSDWDALKAVRLTIVGGESLSSETARLWRNSPLATGRLINAYGPTEATITSTTFEVGTHIEALADAESVPIGRPIPGECVYILDDEGLPVPPGVSGEIHIGGPSLAMGYLNQPELTRARFITNPFLSGSRLYKTGDLACWRDDGTIQFLGRRDEQVKVRGFRVECGEIETSLLGLDGVAQAAVLPRHVDGRTQLVAYIVHADADHPVALEYLRTALAALLPDHMIPADFVQLPRLPLLPSGKCDRAALARRSLNAMPSTAAAPPNSPAERQLLEIWRMVLGRQQIGIHDDFFASGGDSLLALRLVSLVHQQMGQNLPLSALFAAPDIARQAQFLAAHHVDETAVLVPLIPGGVEAPLFLVHALAGHVLCYHELIRQMSGERPIFGLQQAGGTAPVSADTIATWAALYVREIQKVQPHGPYHLAGWSMGGVIAFEMAQQLRAAGESVATLSLIDSYTPAAARAAEAAMAPRDKRADGHADNLLAMDRYVPHRYLGNVQLFAASHTSDGGWRPLIDGHLTVTPISGDHDSLLRLPHVADLAQKLEAFLNAPSN